MRSVTCAVGCILCFLQLSVALCRVIQIYYGKIKEEGVALHTKCIAAGYKNSLQRKCLQKIKKSIEHQKKDKI